MNVVRSNLNPLKRFKLPLFAAVVFFILIIFIVVIFAGGAGLDENKDNSDCSDDATTKSASIKGVNGAWTQKGTKSYNTAKQVFDVWVKKGFSGAQAAGVIGNISVEDPAFKLDQWEYGKEGNPSAGRGLYQFTPWTKYTAGKKGDWSVESQAKGVLSLEPGTIKGYVSSNKNSSPEQCASWWMRNYERPGNYSTEGQRESGARKAYRLFGGSKIKGKGSILGSAAKGASSSSSDNSGDNECDDDDAIGSGGALLTQAKKLIGYFTYGAHTVSGYGSWQHPNKNGQTDCSGFVWLAMKRAGYNVGNDAFATPAMESDAKSSHKWLKQIKAKDVKPGDVIIMNCGVGSGSDGHTAIIAGKYHGYQTKIIEMGGDDHGHVHVSNIHDSFLSLIQKGARVTWARPIKK